MATASAPLAGEELGFLSRELLDADAVVEAE
jgi:hypothetical protein